MEVREIINRASFFAQHHGRLMNAAFTVFPSCAARASEIAATTVVQTFCRDLYQRYGSGEEPFAMITLLERDEDGVLGRVVAHVPQLASNPSCGEDLAEWCCAWRSGDEDDDFHVIEPSAAPFDQDLEYHWDRLLVLCAGLDHIDSAEDDEAKHAQRLLRELKIPKELWRQSAPMKSQVLFFSSSMNQEAIDIASADGMAALSAFDAKAWAWIKRGWELKEYRDRRETLGRRERRIKDIGDLWGDTPRGRSEWASALAEWSADPLSRPRRWSGWWSGGE